MTPNKTIYFLFCGALFVIPMGTSPFTIMGLSILAVWFFSGEFFRQRRRINCSKWAYPIGAIVGLTWLGLIWSADPAGIGISYARKTYYWLYAFALASVNFSNKPSENLIKAFLVGLLINSMVAFLQVGDIVPKFSEWGSTRYTGFYSGYNTLAILLVLGMMMASFFFWRAVNRRGKMLWASFVVIYFIQLILLESRGGYLTFIILLPIIVHKILLGKRFLLMIFVYALAIGIMFSSPVIRYEAKLTVESMKKQFTTEGDTKWGKKYSTHLDRIYMWRWAIDLFLKHPLLGVGTGGYNRAILSEGGDQGIAHPHNNILYVAVSFGVVGLFIFGWFFWILLKTGWHHRYHSEGFFILSSSLVILVGGLTETHILDAGGGFLLAVTAGLQWALQEEVVSNQ